MALLLYNNKKNSNTTKTYQEWLYDTVRKGLAINYDAKLLNIGSIVWVETKLLGRWRKYEITEKELAEKLIDSNPSNYRIKPINIENQLVKDYKTSHLCRRFRLFRFIIFHIRQRPIIMLNNPSIAWAVGVLLMIITIILML